MCRLWPYLHNIWCACAQYAFAHATIRGYFLSNSFHSNDRKYTSLWLNLTGSRVIFRSNIVSSSSGESVYYTCSMYYLDVNCPQASLQCSTGVYVCVCEGGGEFNIVCLHTVDVTLCFYVLLWAFYL